MATIIFILLFTIPAFCPGAKCFYIERQKEIKLFDPILYAFQAIESNFDTDTINRLGYGGILQIGQEMIDEVNRIYKMKGIIKSCTLTDRLDSTKSVQMWYIVQNYWNPSYEIKKACKVWNPLASIKYYNKIKAKLLKQ